MHQYINVEKGLSKIFKRRCFIWFKRMVMTSAAGNCSKDFRKRNTNIGKINEPGLIFIFVLFYFFVRFFVFYFTLIWKWCNKYVEPSVSYCPNVFVVNRIEILKIFPYSTCSSMCVQCPALHWIICANC